jgi:phosphoribosylanthranilate isomerase
MIKHVIHVAGIIDQAEAEMLVECGVLFLGFPFRLAKHKEDLPEKEAGRIIRSLSPDVTCLLITYLSDPRQIVELCREIGVSYVQLHGDIGIDELASLKSVWAELRIVKSLIVGDANLAELEQEIDKTAPYVDGYITDTYDRSTGAMGATGKTHDWLIDRRLVEISPRPVIIAGGLNPDNVREAIRQVHPAGVDVHTGIEGPDGRKDRELARRFVAEAKRGFAGIEAGKVKSYPH